MATIPPALEIPIGDVVKAWREHRGLSATEFAARTGIPKAYIRNWNIARSPRPERSAWPSWPRG